MPELAYTNLEVLKAAQQFRAEDKKYELRHGYRFLSEKAVLNILNDNKLNFIGKGEESVILSRGNFRKHKWWQFGVLEPQNEEATVIAIDYREIKSTIEAKQLFYIHRIMSILFPNNFPRFLSSFSIHSGSENIDISGSVRSKIKVYEIARKVFGGNLDAKSKFPFRTVLDIVAELNLPVSFDETGKNYALGPNRGVFYLDTITFSDISAQARQRLLDWMMQNHYSQRQIKLVENSVSRINVLEKERTQQMSFQPLLL